MIANKKILFLHGAGNSDGSRTDYLDPLLLDMHIERISFDFEGCGSSNVPLEQSSLKRRVEQATDIIKSFQLTEPLNVCGSSMGGYIAIKLLEHFEIANLLLFAPAVYHKDAYNVNFTDEFSKIIRRERSWVDSDAYKLLKKFQGNLLIVIGQQDVVIPKELIGLLLESANQVRKKEFMEIEEADHAIHSFLRNNPEWLKKVLLKISQLVDGK